MPNALVPTLDYRRPEGLWEVGRRWAAWMRAQRHRIVLRRPRPQRRVQLRSVPRRPSDSRRRLRQTERVPRLLRQRAARPRRGGTSCHAAPAGDQRPHRPVRPAASATIPSWDVVGTADHVNPLADQLAMAHNAGATSPRSTPPPLDDRRPRRCQERHRASSQPHPLTPRRTANAGAPRAHVRLRSAGRCQPPAACA